MRTAVRRMRCLRSCCSGELGSAGGLAAAILGTAPPVHLDVCPTILTRARLRARPRYR
jgi:hypothetical protein